MVAWERLGLDAGRATAYLLAARRRFAEEFPYARWKAQDVARRQGLDHRTDVFILGAIGFRTADDDLADWRRRGAEIPGLAVEYFYGTWRGEFGEKLSPERARRELDWIEPFRQGLMAALYFDDEANLARLLEWPGEDLADDEGTTDRTPGDRAFYTVLARGLRGAGAEHGPTSFLGRSIGRRRRPKLLTAVVDALAAGDGAAARGALAAFLRHYRKAEFRQDRVDFVVSVDGTILWHAARRRGVGVGAMPGVLKDLVLGEGGRA